VLRREFQNAVFLTSTLLMKLVEEFIFWVVFNDASNVRNLITVWRKKCFTSLGMVIIIPTIKTRMQSTSYKYERRLYSISFKQSTMLPFGFQFYQSLKLTGSIPQIFRILYGIKAILWFMRLPLLLRPWMWIRSSIMQQIQAS
jgi:hypothetical protein